MSLSMLVIIVTVPDSLTSYSFALMSMFLNLGTVEIKRLDTIAGTFTMMFFLFVLFVYYCNNINVFFLVSLVVGGYEVGLANT
jgi:hypothetical protein